MPRLAPSRPTLHAQIAERLRRDLARAYAPGARFPSQNELGKRFQVSPLTAREAVGLLVQEGLLERRFGSGTYVTERRPEKWLAVLTELDIGHPHTSYYYRRVVNLLREQLIAAGYAARLYIGHTSATSPQPAAITCAEFSRDLETGRILGVVAVATPRGLLAPVARKQVPLVSDDFVGTAKLIDYPEMARRAVQYLVAHGCRHLAFIEHADWRHPSQPRDAFRAAVQALGATTTTGWQAGAIAAGPTPTGLDAFRAIWQSAQRKPDGLVVLDDVAYRELCPALLYNHLRVPEDLMVVSHAVAGDPQPFIPPPVRLEVDPAVIATASSAALLALVEGRPAPAFTAELPLRLEEATAYPALALS